MSPPVSQGSTEEATLQSDPGTKQNLVLNMSRFSAIPTNRSPVLNTFFESNGGHSGSLNAVM